MTTSVQPFAGIYELDRTHSTVQFAVRHQQLSLFRASFSDVDVRLTAEEGSVVLEGRAHVDSVSIAEPTEFRDHVVRGTDFFDADTHPTISFRSTHIELGDDGTATAAGELTIRGKAHSITAHGTYQPTREDPFGSYRAGLELRVTVDRRSWEMNWQMPLPDGSDALGWDVELSAHLELIKTD